MRQCIRTALVLIIAYRLFGAKPLSQPMLGLFHISVMMHTSIVCRIMYYDLQPFVEQL